MGTWREVHTRDRLPPLPPMLGAAGGWRGGLPTQCPTAAQGARLVPMGEEARMPEARKAPGPPMPQEASDTCVRVERQGLTPMTLTPGMGGTADPPVPHGEAPVVRDGDARRRAAARVSNVGRAGTGRLGGDDPGLGVERRAPRCAVLRGAQGCGTRRAGPGARGAGLG